MDDVVAMLEAISSTNFKVFKQLKEIGSKVENLFPKENDVIQVVGAPNFPPPLRESALKNGFTVIQHSYEVRYEVRKPPTNGTDQVSLRLN